MIDEPTDDPTTDDEPTGVASYNGARGVRLPDHRLDALALMTVQGMSVGAMHRMSGVPETTINRLLDGSNEQFQRILEATRSKVFDSVVRDKLNLLELLPDCYAVWKATLRGDDPRLAYQASWDIHNAAIPPAAPGAAQGAGVTVNIGTANTHVASQFTKLFEELPRAIESAMGATHVDPSRYLRTDAEALPAAASIPQEAAESTGVVSPSNGRDH